MFGANTFLRKQGLNALGQVQGIESSLPAGPVQKSRFFQGEGIIDNSEDFAQQQTREEFLRLRARVEEYRNLILEAVADASPSVTVLPAQADRVVCPGVVIRGKSKRQILNLCKDGRRKRLSLDEQGRMEADLGLTRLEYSQVGEETFLSVHSTFESRCYHQCGSGYVSVTVKSQKEIA